MTCPFCGGTGERCHVCDGRGQVSFMVGLWVAAAVWAVPGCRCQVCRRVGPAPGRM